MQTAIDMSCFLPQKIASKNTHHFHTHTPSFTCNFVTRIHIHIHTFIHTYVRTYIHIHTYVNAYYLITYFHTQSFTTSFVFPSFPVPARTFEAHYWKKLTCGVIRSFNWANCVFATVTREFLAYFDRTIAAMFFTPSFAAFVQFSQGDSCTC